MHTIQSPDLMSPMFSPPPCPPVVVFLLFPALNVFIRMCCEILRWRWLPSDALNINKIARRATENLYCLLLIFIVCWIRTRDFIGGMCLHSRRSSVKMEITVSTRLFYVCIMEKSRRLSYFSCRDTAPIFDNCQVSAFN